MDPLSDILSLLKPRSYVSAGLDAGGDWAIRFPAPEGIKFNAIITGACWLTVEGVEAAVRLEEGDCFLLTSGRPFRLATDLALEPIHSDAIYSIARNGIATCNGGGDFFLVGSRFAFSGDDAGILLAMLPPVVHLPRRSDQASTLRWALDLMTRELRDRQPGGVLIAEHLAHLMLMQVLRLYMTDSDPAAVGWLFALADRRMGAAIAAMHGDPAHRWTLQELAGVAGMSRSVFAQKFKQSAGVTPMEYLTRWRMAIGSNRLRNSGDGIAAIAHALGYETESAFCAAFKRVMACSPRQYARRQLAG